MGYTTGTNWDLDLVSETLLNKGFVLLDNEYKHSLYKMTFKDFEGYYYFQSISTFLRQCGRRFDKSNPYTINNINLWCELNKKPFKLLSEHYNNAKEKLEWYCFNCKETFLATWDHIHSGNGCGVCNGFQVTLSNCIATANPKIASEWHPIKNGDLTPYDVRPNSNKKVWWLCSKNKNHEWKVSVGARTKGNGCPYCAGQLPSYDYNLLVCNPTLASEWNYSKNNKKPEDYCPNSGKSVWWKCNECNYEWKATIALRNIRKTGCSECSKSKGEKRIKKYFELKQINYISQKEFNGLIGLGHCNLSYDFYLPDYNLLIEYQGEQHEKPIDFEGKGIKYSTKRFITQQEHDKRKREYAKTNNINLLEIWYWDFDNIEEILSKALQ